jgi:integrase/recombinase XerD
MSEYFSKVLKSYRNYLSFQRRLQSVTVSVYIREVEYFLSFLQKNDLKLDSFKLDDIEKYLESTFSSRNLSSRTSARDFSCLNSFVGFLIMSEYRLDNPLELIDKIKIDYSTPLVVSKEDIEVLLNTMSGDDYLSIRDSALFELIYSCGLRASEVISLNLSNDQGKFLIVTGKRDKMRSIPIGQVARNKLDKYYNESRSHLKKDKTNFIFLGRRGNRLTRQAISKRLEDYCYKCGTIIHLHTLRHCFATHLLQGGADIRIVQELLGHSDIKTTQIYTAIADKELEEGYNKYHINPLQKNSKDKNKEN